MLILVDGAGDTATVWKDLERDLSGPSHAIDLPGRGRHPSDLSRVTVELAVQQAASDIEELTTGRTEVPGTRCGVGDKERAPG